mgnify:FL=1
MTKIINLFGGPGIGKSSISAGLTYNLKKRHITCDNPYEFPKLLAWDENHSAIADQLFVLANQHRGIVKSYGKVEFIILDSPILLSLTYKTYYDKNGGDVYPSNLYGETFNKLLIEINNKYDNINILLDRTKGIHNDIERYQNLEESIELDGEIENTLIQHSLPYHKIKVDDQTVNNIIDLLLQ